MQNPTPIHCHPAPPLLPKASLPQLKKIKITPSPPRSWRSLPPYIKGSGGTRWIPSGYGGCCAAAPPPRCRRGPRNPPAPDFYFFFPLLSPPPLFLHVGRPLSQGCSCRRPPRHDLLLVGLVPEYREEGRGRRLAARSAKCRSGGRTLQTGPAAASPECALRPELQFVSAPRGI